MSLEWGENWQESLFIGYHDAISSLPPEGTETRSCVDMHVDIAVSIGASSFGSMQTGHISVRRQMARGLLQNAMPPTYSRSQVDILILRRTAGFRFTCITATCRAVTYLAYWPPKSTSCDDLAVKHQREIVQACRPLNTSKDSYFRARTAS